MKRGFFILAAALLAAAIANPLVESVANTGVFGPGFSDHDRSSVVPVFEIAILFALVFVAPQKESLISGIARDLSSRAPSSDLPYVLPLQFVALYAMERAECFAHGGVEGGLTWLGGPIVFAIASHVLAGFAITFALGWLLRAIARMLATVVVAVFEAFTVRARAVAIAFARRTFDALAWSSPARVGSTRGRAPPQLPTLV